MLIVADANPLISLLIKPGATLSLLSEKRLTLVTPALCFEEIERNLELIFAKSCLTRAEILRFLDVLRQRIERVPSETYLGKGAEALRICPDKKDVMYFALALHLGCPLWSNEKRLKRQDRVRVYATHELMRMLGL